MRWTAGAAANAGAIDVGVLRLPHISNFDDLDPLDREPSVSLRYITTTAQFGHPDLIVLPGTKSTIADLAWLRARGLADSVTSAVRNGTALIGVCGGYQMLGQRIIDIEGVESGEPSVRGLGLLSASTEFEPAKTTVRVQPGCIHNRGMLAGAQGDRIRGYEIHMGRTYTSESVPFSVEGRTGDPAASFDGAVSADGWMMGTYLHGLFANDDFRANLLKNLARRKGVSVLPQRSLEERTRHTDAWLSRFGRRSICPSFTVCSMNLSNNLAEIRLRKHGAANAPSRWNPQRQERLGRATGRRRRAARSVRGHGRSVRRRNARTNSAAS